MEQININKPIRLIELFGGIGTQAMALRDLGADFERYRLVEFDKYCIKSYNEIHGTEFETMDITETKGIDLGIVDTDKYCYIMTYSFPCTDLSLAGKQAGMSRDESTRSGLLWEVERLLKECRELAEEDPHYGMPDILVMENVPQVHSPKNFGDFNDWMNFLSVSGYTNYYKDLNARNFGVAQNRNRTFMVSILGEYAYDFPVEIPLTKTMIDYLEDEVDEKYYINNTKANLLVEKLIEDGTIGGGRKNHRRAYS